MITRHYLYSKRDLNPHSHCWPRDFKSLVSTDSTIRATLQRTRAENETRTRDPNLGKVVLYQLSYFRVCGCKCREFYEILQIFFHFFFQDVCFFTKNTKHKPTKSLLINDAKFVLPQLKRQITITRIIFTDRCNADAVQKGDVFNLFAELHKYRYLLDFSFSILAKN